MASDSLGDRSHRSGRLRSSSPPTVVEEDALAVDRDLDLMRVLEPANRFEVGAKELERKAVLGVEREVMVDDQPADGAERQALDVLILRAILADAIRVRSRRDRRRRRPAR